MDTSKLRPDTRAVWEKFQGQPLLKGFVLIGGTALTLRIGHRVSEDLDLAFPAIRLPVDRLRLFVRRMEQAGVRLTLNQNPLDVEHFLDSGMDLGDYQQNYLANDSVKISFIAPESETADVLRQDPDAPLRVASLDEIFATKCLACADRNKTRDWFDLYVLIKEHGFTMQDMHEVFRRLGVLQKFDIAGMRLRACKPGLSDEGYEHLLAEAPTLDGMRSFFAQKLDAFEIELAREAFQARAMERGQQ
jgi:predicted nucleotidyltransferase component of viral defense system